MPGTRTTMRDDFFIICACSNLNTTVEVSLRILYILLRGDPKQASLNTVVVRPNFKRVDYLTQYFRQRTLKPQDFDQDTFKIQCVTCAHPRPDSEQGTRREPSCSTRTVVGPDVGYGIMWH